MTNDRKSALDWASAASERELTVLLGAFDRLVWQGASLTPYEWEVHQAAKAEANRRHESAEER